MQFMQEQLQQIQHESELTFNQLRLIKEQLNIEIAARVDSQVCVQLRSYEMNSFLSF